MVSFTVLVSINEVEVEGSMEMEEGGIISTVETGVAEVSLGEGEAEVEETEPYLSRRCRTCK